jgi:hypothetical protein
MARNRSVLNIVLRAILGKGFFVAYFVLGIIHFIALPRSVYWRIPWITWDKSFFMTLGLMTGSDPYSFKELLEPHVFIWILAWLIHVASWLLIPALIALVITEAKDDIKKDQSIQRGIHDLLIAAGVSQDSLAAASDEITSEIEKWGKNLLDKEWS